MGRRYFLGAYKIWYILIIINGLPYAAKGWQAGYNFRKKITISKSAFPGSADVANLRFLLVLQDEALKFTSGDCASNKVSGYKNGDLCFATATGQEMQLNAQIDQYDPVTGKLICWIDLPSLAPFASTSPATSFYIYYGSNYLHDKYSPEAVNTWSGTFGVWHMNPETSPTSLRNAASSNQLDVALGTELLMSSYSEGKIGTAVHLNGTSQSLTAKAYTNSYFSIASWIRIDQRNTEQILLSNHSNDGGYELVLLPDATIQVRVYNHGFLYSLESTTHCVVGQWYKINAALQLNSLSLHINGLLEGSVGRVELKMSAGGAIHVGGSAVSTHFFMGSVDELQLQLQAKSNDLILAEYLNQNNPPACYTAGAEEIATGLQPIGALFEGTINDNWLDPANWNIQSVPATNATIIIAKNKKASLNFTPANVGQLYLQQGAELLLASDLELSCGLTLAAYAIINLANGVNLKCKGNIVNDGFIAGSEGAMILSGIATQSISGAGNIRVGKVMVNLNSPNSRCHLLQPMYVTAELRSERGGLETHGNLTLGINGQNKTAQLFPSPDVSLAEVIGVVTIEKYVDGSFSGPATARGWRLLSSPVYQTQSAAKPFYSLEQLKNAMFITGKGGATNGFDDAPLNGNTIYVYRADLSGNLGEKYQAVDYLNQKLPLGDGSFIFSRGSRLLPDAYVRQVLNPPFIDPLGFTLSFTGLLWTTTLIKQLYNADKGGAADGFNLLGNPYPYAIKWGSLIKTNISPYIWFYDPVNQAYQVTDNPDTEIPTAAAFFVKVNPGFLTGSISFDPSARYSATAPLSTASTGNNMLTLTLSTADIYQQYALKLSLDANDLADADDAESIGKGILSVAALSPEMKLLSIDHRKLSAEKKHIRLSVKGQFSGQFKLFFEGLETFSSSARLTLEDRFLSLRMPFSGKIFNYLFDIDKAKPETEGDDRFVLHIEGAKPSDQDENFVTVYPNPFTTTFYIKAKTGFPENVRLNIRDVVGNLVMSRTWTSVRKSDVLSLMATALNKGVYFLELINTATNLQFKFAKLIKQ